MHRVSVDDMFSGKKSRYSLVIAVAKRAREITDEINSSNKLSTEKPVSLAIDDFKQHKYEILEPEVDN